MRKILFLSGCLVCVLTQALFAQERIEAPLWNVGDRWVFSQGITAEVNETNHEGYIVRLPNEKILFDRSTLNRTFRLSQGRQEPYKDSQRRLFDFPLVIGKRWKDKYSAVLKWEDTYASRTTGVTPGEETIFFENYRVLGLEDVEVQAGKFKALKIEYTRQWTSPTAGNMEGKAWYWYAPDVKHIVKYEYGKNQMWSKETNWELVSFTVAK